jgi:hypothetical protein
MKLDDGVELMGGGLCPIAPRRGTALFFEGGRRIRAQQTHPLTASSFHPLNSYLSLTSAHIYDAGRQTQDQPPSPPTPSAAFSSKTRTVHQSRPQPPTSAHAPTKCTNLKRYQGMYNSLCVKYMCVCLLQGCSDRGRSTAILAMVVVEGACVALCFDLAFVSCWQRRNQHHHHQGNARAQQRRSAARARQSSPTASMPPILPRARINDASGEGYALAKSNSANAGGTLRAYISHNVGVRARVYVCVCVC